MEDESWHLSLVWDDSPQFIAAAIFSDQERNMLEGARQASTLGIESPRNEGTQLPLQCVLLHLASTMCVYAIAHPAAGHITGGVPAGSWAISGGASKQAVQAAEGRDPAGSGGLGSRVLGAVVWREALDLEW